MDGFGDDDDDDDGLFPPFFFHISHSLSLSLTDASMVCLAVEQCCLVGVKVGPPSCAQMLCSDIYSEPKTAVRYKPDLPALFIVTRLDFGVCWK